MTSFPHIPLTPFHPDVPEAEAARRFFEVMNQRRSVRYFSSRPVNRETIEWIIRAANTAPSGANKQPWRFIAIDEPSLKHEIRLGAELEESEFYDRKANPQWLADLAPLQTGPDKEFLEVAPYLIAVFKLTKTDHGGQVYYANESVGIAVGFLLAAIHHAGLVALTHTPSPMGFLSSILRRPTHERPYLLIPVGYPAPGCMVPDIKRKDLSDAMVWNRRPD